MAGKGDKFRPTKLKEYRENYDNINWNPNIIHCCNCGGIIDKQKLNDNPELYIIHEDSKIEHKNCNFN